LQPREDELPGLHRLVGPGCEGPERRTGRGRQGARSRREPLPQEGPAAEQLGNAREAAGNLLRGAAGREIMLAMDVIRWIGLSDDNKDLYTTLDAELSELKKTSRPWKPYHTNKLLVYARNN
jgi:hypothetical protein